MKILARNLSRKITEQELKKIFEPFGKVSGLTLVLDAETGTSKGFGYIEMPNLAEATEAINTLNGQRLEGNKIRVKDANDNKINIQQ